MTLPTSRDLSHNTQQAVLMLPAAWDRVRETDSRAAELFDTPSGEDVAAEVSSWLATAEPLLTTYFTLENPAQLEPAQRELRVETTLDDGLVLRGFVDRLDVNPAGDTRVVDYKTGRSPTPGFESKALFQMRFYALVLWRSTGQLPRLLQLLYLGNGEILRYEPDEADLRATERKIVAIWGAIERARDSGDWRPSPSKLCDWCDHKALCPAFGGIAPPLPTGTVTLEIEPVAGSKVLEPEPLG